MSPRSRTPQRTSLRACTLDGTLHAAMVGFGEIYFAAFALLLGATPFQVGILVTMPMLSGSIFQFFTPALARRVGEKRWVVMGALVQALTFLPIVRLGITGGGFAGLLPWVCLYWVAILGLSPAWNSWMGRMIPALIRSRYFGRRNVSIHLTVFLSVTAGGFLIHAASESEWGPASGFIAVFAIAAASRLGSAWFLTRQHDPYVRSDEPAPALRAVLTRFRTQPYGRLILLLVAINASVNVSAAYFTPFMLEGLQLSYARYTILTGTIVAARMLASPYWGEIALAYGNRRALQVATTMLVPLSALWIVSDNFAYLIALQLFAGFAWAGYELTLFLNFFDCTTPENRSRVLSVYNLLNGVAIVTGSLAGGTVLRWLGDGGYAWIFLASSTLRLISVVFLGRGVGRRRAPAEHSFRNVFLRVLTLRPGQGPDDRPLILPEKGTTRGDATKGDAVSL